MATANSTLPPELEAQRKKDAKNEKAVQAKTAKQKKREEKAVKKGVKAAKGKQPASIGTLIAGFLYGIFFMLLLIAVATAFYYFDIGEVRTMVISGLQVDKDSHTILENRRAEIRKIEAELETEKTQLEIDKSQLIQKEENLKVVDQELEERQVSLEHQEILLEGKQTELADIIKMYEEMDAGAAASILTEMKDTSNVVKILRSLSQAKAAQIMGQLEPEKASEITALMLNSAVS